MWFSPRAGVSLGLPSATSGPLKHTPGTVSQGRRLKRRACISNADRCRGPITARESFDLLEMLTDRLSGRW
jgi:hypothetical protein